MKFNLVRNDKKTALDELYLFLFIVANILVGIFLVRQEPSFWIFDSAIFKALGILLILTGVMFIPGLIYRLMTNDKK